MTAKTNGTRTEPTLHDVYEQPHLTVAATWQDPKTKALYVHQDLVQMQRPWDEESHVSPMNGTWAFGDVESFTHYVSRYGQTNSTLLTWNSRGLLATLDYFDETSGEPGRCQWRAMMPFVPSLAWTKWNSFGNNYSLGQKQAVEILEDLSADIVDPSAADLLGILRGLRTSLNAKAETELLPDGTSRIAFEKDTKVQSSRQLDLPPTFRIAIPVLKGHTTPEGKPVVYQLDVRVRVSVDDNAKLTLRFSLPNAERVLEDVYAERVQVAQGLLGDEYVLLRAAD